MDAVIDKVIPTERIQTGQELERCPFPIPFGWYVVALSDSLAKGEVQNVQAFDQEWVMFRGEDGSVGVTDPYCPHLGAHLGHGGKVIGNNIRCPFHHWEYDSRGWCKNIPYSKVMPGICSKKAVLNALPVQEKYGLIFVWYHPKNDQPSFEIPTVLELEAEGYIPIRRGQWDISTCLQEIGENSVDTPHLKFLHGSSVIPPVEASIDGPIFYFNIGNGYVVGTSYGPGIQVVRHTQNNISVLMFSTPLPVSTEMSLSRMHFTFKDYPEGSKERALAETIYQHSIGEAEGKESAGFESVDLVIWDNKKYRPQPLLCDGDGPIMKWRNYYKQFYVGAS